MKNIISTVILFLFISSTIFSQTNTKTQQDEIDNLISFCHENGLFSGTIMVTQNGESIYENALGFSDEASSTNLTNESAFYLCSVSKQFTSMAIMILNERHELNYDDVLSKYFPNFPNYADSVTIKHLMTHTSGIPDHYNLGIYKPGLTNADVFDLLVKQEKLDFQPGEKYSYSNGGYVLLAMIVEKASGLPLHIFMNDNIFKPLEMTRSLVFDESSPNIENRAKGYNQLGDLDDYEIFTTGAGGIFSTIDDLHKWDQALYTEKLISSETLDEAFTSTILNSGEFSNYGYGWSVSENEGKKSVSHSGSLSGYRTYIRRNLYDNSGYIILTNNGSAVAMGDITEALNNILNNATYELPKIPISSKLAAGLKSGNAANAINEVKTILERNPEKYAADEGNINALGYDYLSQKNLDTALAIFQLNVELNPNASNVYDSLAEAQLANGDTIQSIKNYRKSYTLNRNNTNAITVLNGIGNDTSDLISDLVLPIELLETYVGNYELSPNLILAISRTEQQLFVYPSGQIKSEIFPSTENRFYSKLVAAQVTFNKDENGKIISLTLHQNGDHLAKRID